MGSCLDAGDIDRAIASAHVHGRRVTPLPTRLFYDARTGVIPYANLAVWQSLVETAPAIQIKSLQQSIIPFSCGNFIVFQKTKKILVWLLTLQYTKMWK